MTARTTFLLTSIVAVSFLTIAATSSAVLAQDIAAACVSDINGADIKPGGGRIEACLKDHFADVSDPCKETISQAASKS